jgi:enoyl-CoA hydratase/carnithine racemase
MEVMTAILLERRGSTAWITLNRPQEMNALSDTMCSELLAAIEQIERDPQIRVLVLTGAGRAFCAGADLKGVFESAGTEPGAGDPMTAFLDLVAGMIERLRALPKPTIAALNGLTMAGGLELAMACDLIIAAESTRIGDAHANFGVFPGAGGTAVLPRRIGATAAKYLLFTGDTQSAAELVPLGLVNRVVPDAELTAEVDKLASAHRQQEPAGAAAHEAGRGRRPGATAGRGAAHGAAGARRAPPFARHPRGPRGLRRQTQARVQGLLIQRSPFGADPMSSPQPAVYVAGVGMTPTGKFLDRSIKQLTADAVMAALADASLQAGDIQSAFFSNATQGALEGQTMVRGQIALRSMGIESIPVYNLENACASASSAFNLAVQYVRSGEGEIALAVGAEKMFCTDKAKMFSVFDGAWDLQTVEANKRTLLAMGDGVEPPEGTTSKAPYSLFMDIYAAFGRFHMREFGTTQRSSPRWRPRTTATRHTTRWPSTATRTPSTRSSPRRRSPIR